MDKEVVGILVAAHELKAPLALLRQLALSLDNIDAPNEHIRSEMVRVSERAIKQVNDLAKIRRLEDGLFEMEPFISASSLQNYHRQCMISHCPMGCDGEPAGLGEKPV